MCALDLSSIKVKDKVMTTLVTVGTFSLIEWRVLVVVLILGSKKSFLISKVEDCYVNNNSFERLA